MAKAATRLALIMLVMSTIGCDHATKRIAAAALERGSSRSFLADTVRFEYAENTGGFLSLGSEWPAMARTTLFTGLTGLALLAMSAMAVRRDGRALASIGLALFIAGGVSNWVERLSTGRVIDFMNVGIGGVRTGIFNVADVAITCGVALYLWTELRNSDRPRAHSCRP